MGQLRRLHLSNYCLDAFPPELAGMHALPELHITNARLSQFASQNIDLSGERLGPARLMRSCAPPLPASFPPATGRVEKGGPPQV